MTERRATYRTSSRARKVDAIQQPIIDALTAAGCKVIDTSGVGRGFPDLVVIRGDGSVVLVEVKGVDGKVGKAQLELMLHMVAETYRIFVSPEQAANYINRWG